MDIEIDEHAPLAVDESFRHQNLRGWDMSGPLKFMDESWKPTDEILDPEGADPADICLFYIEEAILLENRPAFVKLINNAPFAFLHEHFREIDGHMALWDAGVCAAAIFDGETKLSEIPAWTAWLSDNPLHEAAVGGAFKMAALLLQRGFSADVRADLDEFKAALPLDIALSRLRQEIELMSVCSSETELVPKLCEQTVGMRLCLETLRVIAQSTRDIKRVFFNCLKKGMAIEVGALLMVAKSRVLSSSTNTAKGEFRSICEMHDFVLNAKCQVSPTDTDKLVDMEETLVLLKIFDKIGHKLATLLWADLRACRIGKRCISGVVAEALIQAAGFDANPKIVNSNNSSTRGSAIEFASTKADPTTGELPSWVKEAALRGLGDKSGNTSRLPYPSRLLYPFVLKPPPSILGTVRRLSSVAVSPLSSGSVPMPVTKLLLQHLVKKRASILGTIRNMSRFG